MLLWRTKRFFRRLKKQSPTISGCDRHRIPSDSPQPCPFRLFKINGHAPDGNLDLTLLKGEPCHKVKQYAALSYAWEGQTPDCIVYRDGEQALVTDSLQAFLAVLLEKYGPNKFYWADQLCVSQVDSSDKERQVPLMDTYFAGAQQVLIWWGVSTPRTDVCCDMIDDVIRVVHDPRTNPDDAAPEDYFPGALGYAPEVEDRFWQGLYELCSREWWRRVWTLQEYLLAKQAIFHCGSRSGDIAQVNMIVARKRYSYPPFGSVNNGTLSMFQNIFACDLKRHLDSPVAFTVDLLMDLARARESKQKIDKVFGLLSISSAAARASLKVQYEGEEYWTTWIRWAHLGLQEKGGYRLLISRPWPRHPRLPSWCPNLGSPIRKVFSIYQFRADGRLEVKDELSEYPFPLAVTFDERGLICKGLLVDTVKEVVRPGESKVIAHVQDLERLGYRHVDDSTRHEMRESGSFVARSWVLAHESSDEPERAWIDFLRTITYDNIMYPDKIRPTDAELGRSFLELGKEGEGTQAENLIKTRGIRAVIEVECKGRAFFTTETGMMGLGPLDIKAGDLVCIFPGVPTPVILRRASVDLQGNTIQLIQLEAGKEHIGCTFLGGAFVQGIIIRRAVRSILLVPRQARMVEAFKDIDTRFVDPAASIDALEADSLRRSTALTL
ncbi:hypothetical protein LTR96_009563 [Exophiala xenobiotica]|nr:hypothetical protein LTR96_009563 [Exophiala xenobiotica]KAK5333956.1 hypothetical protein LTR98_009867 [Exophiala xenobiotica]KAK5553014.1 hypothetical protein LTR46_009090 [Exophiala xenobiotica]